MRTFIRKYYKVIFWSSLLEGTVLLLLFISGLVRYRFALMLGVTGLYEATKRFFEVKDTKNQINWKPVNKVVSLLLMLAIFFDLRDGQLFPKYPNLPAWESLIVAAAGYFLTFLSRPKLGRWVQKLDGNEVFTVCPSCGYGHIQVVEQCKNCGYKDGMPLKELEGESEISEGLSKEIEGYKTAGLLRKVSKDVLTGLKLSHDEHILIAMKSPNIFYFVGLEKNGSRMMPGWFIMSSKKIICYYGLEGWREIDFVLYPEIKEVSILKAQVVYTKKNKLKIDTQNDSYLFLFGTSTKKLFRRIMAFDATNEPILRNILNCIEKRKKEMGASNAHNRLGKKAGRYVINK